MLRPRLLAGLAVQGPARARSRVTPAVRPPLDPNAAPTTPGADDWLGPRGTRAHAWFMGDTTAAEPQGVRSVCPPGPAHSEPQSGRAWWGEHRAPPGPYLAVSLDGLQRDALLRGRHGSDFAHERHLPGWAVTQGLGHDCPAREVCRTEAERPPSPVRLGPRCVLHGAPAGPAACTGGQEAAHTPHRALRCGPGPRCPGEGDTKPRLRRRTGSQQVC